MILSLVTAVKDCPDQVINSYVRLSNFEAENIEILFVYDHDDENTKKAILELSAKLKNIRAVCSREKGLYSALNTGIDAANGEFIYFLGIDDDFDYDRYLENVFNILQKNSKASIFLLPVRIGDIHTGRLRYPGSTSIPAVLHHQSIIFNSNFIRSNNIYYDTTYKIHSDFDFIQKVLMIKNVSIHCINYPLVTFRKGGLSTSKTNLLRGSIELLNIFRKYNSLITIKCMLAILRKFYYFIASLFRA